MQLDGFRNYASLDLAVAPGMHVFAGANAQGKTNLLEAVYLAATGHSPRTNQESELINWEREVARVVAEVTSERRGAFTIEVSLGRKSTTLDADQPQRGGGTAEKRLKVNGAPRAIGDLAGLAPVVLFLVDDLEIIRGEPARRRAFLDTDLAAISRTYQWALRQYGRVVGQRNKLLKDIREGLVEPFALGPWNDQLATFGGRLLEVRARFVADLNRETAPVYQGLSASTQEMTLSYQREWGEPGDAEGTRDAYAALLTAAMREMEGEEIARGSSLVGPHRDDIDLLVSGKDVRHFGSQGEQRTAALALRVSECRLMRRLVGEPPLLLLDDVLSELDQSRRAALLEHLAPMGQVILTTTDVDALGLPPHAAVRVSQVEKGTVLGA